MSAPGTLIARASNLSNGDDRSFSSEVRRLEQTRPYKQRSQLFSRILRKESLIDAQPKTQYPIPPWIRRPAKTEAPTHQEFFYLVIAVVTVALAWILAPFFGAVFWGTILAIIVHPMQRYVAARFGKGRNLAALTTLLGTILIVIWPLSVLPATMVQEISLAYTSLKLAQPDMTGFFSMRSRRCLPGCRRFSANSDRSM